MSGQAQRACDKWNRQNKIGDVVILKRDSGTEETVTTRTDAFVCNAGYPVIFLNGVRGYYLLERVRPA